VKHLNIGAESDRRACETIYSVSKKSPALKFSDIFSQTVGNF